MLAISITQEIIPQIKVKDSFDLEERLLPTIDKLTEDSKAELLGIAAPKLKTKRLAEAFVMLMSVENSLTKGLALVSFLPYLEKKDLGVATKTIFSCIEAVVSQEEKFDLASKFIKQLNENIENGKLPNELYIIKLPESIALMIKNGFSLNQQIILEGAACSLMGWQDSLKYYSSYPEEKTRFVETAKVSGKPKEKYLILLSLLKHFPLDQQEIAELSNLALQTLKQQGDTENISSNDSTEDNSIRLEDRIELLKFLPVGNIKDSIEETYENFAGELYREISKSEGSLIDKIGKFNLFLNSYCLEPTQEEWNYGGIASHDIGWLERDVYSAIQYSDASYKDEQYFELASLLTSEQWFDNKFGNSHSGTFYLTEQIKSPIMKLDALILLIEAIKRDFHIIEANSFYPKLVKKRKQLAIQQALNTSVLIEGKEEQILLTTKLLSYLSPSIKKQTASKLLSEIALIPNEVTKAEFLVDLLPHLTSKLQKQAFSLAQSITNKVNKTWALTAFALYLSDSQKEKTLKQAIERLEKPTSTIEKTLLIKQLIRFGF